MRILTPEEARRLDAAAIAGGTPGIVLMERASGAVAREVRRLLRHRPESGEDVVVLAGAGNNGGDAFEAARLLASDPAIRRLTTLFLGAPERLPADARETWRRLGAVARIDPAQTPADLEPLRRASLVVDGLFGTGLARPLDAAGLPALAAAISSAGRARVVAVDLPSGLAGGCGATEGPHFVADVTVTFGFPKMAHVDLPAAGACGRVVVAPIGLPEETSDPAPQGERTAVAARDVARLFPGREPTAHKGTFGTVGVVGGSEGMAGAPALAARAAFRAGAGKVVVAAPPGVRAVAHALCPEATTAPEDACPADARALAVGPGLGTADGSLSRLAAALERPVAAVFDADALNLVAGSPERFSARTAPTVLTPHPGEAARLLGVPTERITADRAGAALELARRSGAVVVLKGFRSLVASPDGRLSVVLAGNPGMATGGSGDVLTGIVAALLARGLTARQAAEAGAYLHGAAGDLSAERLGQESLSAGDVVDGIPEAFSLLAESRLP